MSTLRIRRKKSVQEIVIIGRRWERDIPTRLEFMCRIFFLLMEIMRYARVERCAAVDDNKNPFSSLGLCLWESKDWIFIFAIASRLARLFSLFAYDNNNDLSGTGWIYGSLDVNNFALLSRATTWEDSFFYYLFSDVLFQKFQQEKKSTTPLCARHAVNDQIFLNISS